LDASISFGLLAALCWGSSDFVAKITAGRIGALRTALFLQYLGGILLLLLLAGEIPLLWQFPTEAYLVLGIGVINSVAVFCLYKGFEVGQLSIISPIASSYPALSTILAVFLLNETVSQERLIGILAILGGIVLVSFQRGSAGALEKKGIAAGVGYAIAAFLSLGFMFFALKLVVNDLGAFLPVLLIRIVCSLILTAVVVLAPKHSHGLNSRDLLLVGVIGVVDTVGNVVYNLGIITGAVSVVSTVSGLFSAITVLLAFIILKERLLPHQGVGLLAILVGVSIIGYVG